jgi:thiamine biosynthesis lipoprotein
MAEAVNMRTETFHAMGTEILLAAVLPEPESEAEVQAGFQAARDYIANQEQRFSRFREDSELNELNRAAGRWLDVSPEMKAVLTEALYLHVQTGGLFDPAVLPALERAGYDRTLSEVWARADLPAESVPVTIVRSGFAEIELEAGRVRLPEGMRIDLGGIAKGWIAENAARVLENYSPDCLVDAGGDMFMIGLPEGETAWPVALEDPRDPEHDLALLQLQPGAVATSSVTRRRWERGGRVFHHLIDPRTGQPAGTEWLSVTVAAEHAVEAEVYAKSLLIGGALEAARMTDSTPGFRYLAVDRQGKLWGSKSSWELIHV